MPDPPPRSTNSKPRNPNWGGRREGSGSKKKKNTSALTESRKPAASASVETPRTVLKITVPPLPLASNNTRNSKRGALLNHNPEERIGNPDELEPTTLIGRKKRKRRIDDKENPSDSEPESDHKTKTFKLARTAGELIYSCKIDSVSEAEIVDEIQTINYSIDNLISNILVAVKGSHLSYHKVPSSPRRKIENKKNSDILSNSNPDLDIPVLLSLLIDSPSQLSDDTRDFVVEIILHNLISLIIHKHFFEGRHFFAVGSEFYLEYLETVFSKLVAGNIWDPAVIQRWRAISVEGVFQTDDNLNIDSQLYDELISHIERMLKIAFPLCPSPVESNLENVNPDSESIYKSIVHEEENSLLDVIRQARRISYIIQQVVCCQVLVTTARSMQESSDDGEDILGTKSFGLQKILGTKRTVLLRPRVLTSAALRSHLL